MTTIRDVAERAEVSVGTVSRVLNDHPSVNPAIRRAVLAAIEALDYRPNAIARTLRTSRTRTIGFLISDLRSPQLAVLSIRGAEAAAAERGYAMLVVNSQRDEAAEARLVGNLLDRKVDGLLFAPVGSPAVIAGMVKRAAVPAVAYARHRASGLLPEALLDESAAVDDAAAELLTLDHRRIAIVHDDHQTGRMRADAFRGSFRRQGGAGVTVAQHEVASGDAAGMLVRRLLAAGTGPSALVLGAVYLIPAVLLALRGLELRVPEDISLICFGSSEWAEVVEPSLSTISLDLEAHLRAATWLLLDLVEGRGATLGPVRHEGAYLRRRSVARAAG